MKSLGEPITLGRTAEIYPWREGWVLKLFFDEFSANAKYEAAISRIVQSAKLPVPAVGELIEVNGRLGLIYERVDGVSMAEKLSGASLSEHKPISNLAHIFADLHADMHTHQIELALPAQRKRLECKIQEADMLPAHLRDAALEALHKMPDGRRLCHGDFHPDNIIMATQGAIIIDWNDGTIGNPMADVARTSMLLEGFQTTNPSYSRLINLFHTTYLKRYFQLAASDQQQFAFWRPLVAAARMSENVADEQDWLLAQVETELFKGDRG